MVAVTSNSTTLPSRNPDSANSTLMAWFPGSSKLTSKLNSPLALVDIRDGGPSSILSRISWLGMGSPASSSSFPVSPTGRSTGILSGPLNSNLAPE